MSDEPPTRRSPGRPKSTAPSSTTLDLAVVTAMKNEGASLREIARRLGVDFKTVHSFWKRWGPMDDAIQ